MSVKSNEFKDEVINVLRSFKCESETAKALISSAVNKLHSTIDKPLTENPTIELV
jgi:hypothetical protein